MLPDLTSLSVDVLRAHTRSDLTPFTKYLVWHAEDDSSRYLFPPYVPFVGKRHDIARILVYAKAQNLAGSPGHRCHLRHMGDDAVRRLSSRGELTTWRDIPIRPVEAGVLPAVAGLFLYAEREIQLPSLGEATDHAAFTNFYKYSLWRAGNSVENDRKYNDLNPDKLPSQRLLADFTTLNLQEYVTREIVALAPRIVICLKGYFVSRLRGYLERCHPSCRLVEINDPAWILRGGGGNLGVGGSWRRQRLSDRKAVNLIDGYCEQIREEGEAKYRKRTAEIRPYLAHYYLHFRSLLAE